jgi:hypothetical protein
MRWAFLILLLVFAFGCTQPSTRFINEYLCPNGSFVDNESRCGEFKPSYHSVNPDDYQCIIVDFSHGAPNYVKAGGNVSVVLEIKGGEVFYIWNSTVAQYTSPNATDVSLTKLSGDVYVASFTAPKELGVHKDKVIKRNKTSSGIEIATYNLTVISEVNETGAYDVVYSFMLDQVMEEDSFDAGWGYYECGRSWLYISSEEATETEEIWDITMETQYVRAICANDISGGYAVNTTVTGHYTVDKQTGLIIG